MYRNHHRSVDSETDFYLNSISRQSLKHRLNVNTHPEFNFGFVAIMKAPLTSSYTIGKLYTAFPDREGEGLSTLLILMSFEGMR